jgi:diketogulonate reductase-like aldo/keto reductase
VPRDESVHHYRVLFGNEDPVAEAVQSPRQLGVDQVDLYLVHFPKAVPPGHGRGWSALANWVRRSIGVSNFSASELAEVIAAGTIPPAVNQAQFSSPQYRRALLVACRRQSVALEAYSLWGLAGACLTRR